ncbi:MAG: hypothetical protein KJ070_23535 [Verrucomicrobia bacterium]|nr:hypothetical protein [Verrucomicrobiota bacterium]
MKAANSELRTPNQTQHPERKIRNPTPLHRRLVHAAFYCLLSAFGLPLAAFSQSTAFTYQGQLTDDAAPATGVYDFNFRLYATSNGAGIPLGTVTVDDASVTNGLFTVQLDFGAAAFSGNPRWLQISVRPGASTGAYAALTPLQAVTPIPYAITALGAAAGSINSTALANGAVTAGKLASNSVTALSLGTNVVVNTANIADGAVTSNKLAEASVGDPQLQRRYDSGFIVDAFTYLRLEPDQRSPINFKTSFATTPALSMGMETLTQSFAQSAFPRATDRTTNGFTLLYTVNEAFHGWVAGSGTNDILGIDAGLFFGRPGVAYASSATCIGYFVPTGTNCVEETRCYCTTTIGLSNTIVSRCLDGLIPGEETCPGGGSKSYEVYTNCTTVGITNQYCTGALFFARAEDDFGSSFTPVSVVTTGQPAEPSVASIGLIPGIAFYDRNATSLRYVQASDALGTAWNPPTTVANHADVGRYCSLAYINGQPAISFFNATSNNLEYVRYSGFGWGAPVIVEGTGGAGRHSSLMVVNDRPAIACFRSPIVGAPGALVYYRASDVNGSTWSSRITVEANIGDLNEGSSVTNGPVISLAMVAGSPAIAYYDAEENVMKYVRAATTNGATWGTPTTLGTFIVPGGGTCRLSVLDGRPTVLYAVGADVRVATAKDALGTAWNNSVRLVQGFPGTKAQVGGLVNLPLRDRAAMFHFSRPLGEPQLAVRYLTRNPPPYAINWIAVQP